MKDEKKFMVMSNVAWAGVHYGYIKSQIFLFNLGYGDIIIKDPKFRHSTWIHSMNLNFL